MSQKLKKGQPKKDSSASNAKRPKTLSEKSRRQLDDMAARFGIEEVAAEMWQFVFSAEERKKLGKGFKSARKKHRGTIGMAMAAWCCSRDQATVRLCEAFGSYDPTTLKRLRAELGIEPPISDAPPSDKPVWDGRKLRVRGKIVRQIRGRSVATRVAPILDEFERQNWPECISDPLKDPHTYQRLREAIYNLNLRLTVIRFRSNGSGNGVCWEWAS